MSESRTTCWCVREHGIAAMIYDDQVGVVTLSLSLEGFVRMNELDEHVAEFPAFPGRLGIADSHDEALDSLCGVVKEWITLFLEHNDLEPFQAYLIDHCGFELVQRPFTPATEIEGAELALLQFPVSGLHDDSNAVQ